MSEQTQHLKLPYIMPSQAQKHITHNEAIKIIDALVHLSVNSDEETEPPAQRENGARYIIAASPTGDWANRQHQIANWQDGAWAYFEPQPGWLAYVASRAEVLAFDGEMWSTITAETGEQAPQFGINTSADSTNRLAAKTDAVLFSHDDVTPGTGDVRVTVNKAAEDKTASLLFQTSWSGRAELGLAGEDEFALKVSADGTNWNEALRADAAGQVAFPNGIFHGASGQKPQGFIGIPGTSGSMFRISRAHGQNPRNAIIEAVAGDTITLTTEDADLFMSRQMAGDAYVRIWNTTRSADQHSAWVKIGEQRSGTTSSGGVTFTETTNSELIVTDQADLTDWQAGDIVQIGDPTTITPGRCATYDISPMMQNRYGKVFRQSAVLAKYTISGDTSQLSQLQTVGIGITPDGSGGSFNNAASNNQGVASQGILYIPCSRPSPISNSNLISMRESATGETIKTSLISVLGLMVEM